MVERRYRSSQPRRQTQSRRAPQTQHSTRTRQPYHQQYQRSNYTQRQVSRGSSNARPPRNRFLLVIPILVIIVIACIIRFVACAPANESTQSIATSSSTSTDVSAASDPADNKATAIATDPQDRTKTSASANDVKPTEKVVYLTFDDGPSGHTQQILDTLDSYGIKATWFILGNTGHIDTVKDIWNAGHQVGLHSDEHDYDYIYANADNFVADINKIGSAVSEQIGFMPTLIRFPGGSVNGYNAGRSDAFKQAAADQGWHYFDWNVSIGDSTQPPAPVEALVENIKRESEGCNSCCVLMHDSDFKPTTADALPQIIDYFKSQGYSFDILTADSFGYHF